MFRNSSAIKKDKEKIDNLSEMNSINLDVLPPEILKIIVSLLSDKDLVNLSLVNKNLNYVTKDVIDDRFNIFMPQLEEQYKKIHDDNESLQAAMSAQLVADRTFFQRLIPALITCGLSEIYINIDSDSITRICSGLSIGLSILSINLGIMIGLSILLFVHSDHFHDESENNILPEVAWGVGSIAIILLMMSACILNALLMRRICRNSGDYAMSSLRLFSGRRTEAELSNRLGELEKRMEEGEANNQEKNTQKAIDAEEFNSRLRIEPLDFDVDETTPLLAARP